MDETLEYAKKYCKGCRAYEAKSSLLQFRSICAMAHKLVSEQLNYCPCSDCLIKVKCKKYCKRYWLMLG